MTGKSPDFVGQWTARQISGTSNSSVIVVTLGRTIRSAVHAVERRPPLRASRARPDELAVRIPISEAAAGLPVVVAALVVVELDRISRSQRRMISRPMRSTSSPGPLSRKPSAGFA